MIKIRCKLGDILHERRLSVADLQRMTGLSRGALDKLAHDRAASFDRKVMERICDALAIQPGELFGVLTQGDLFGSESQQNADRK
jgi:putative transcriptional regulator